MSTQIASEEARGEPHLPNCQMRGNCGCPPGFGDNILTMADRAARNGLSLSQQHRSDMLRLCAEIYGLGSPTYRRFLTNQDSVPPLPDAWKPAGLTLADWERPVFDGPRKPGPMRVNTEADE